MPVRLPRGRRSAAATAWVRCAVTASADCPAGGPRVLRVLDALTRWYAQPPVDDLGLARALDHAGRVRPGHACWCWPIRSRPSAFRPRAGARWPSITISAWCCWLIRWNCIPSAALRSRPQQRIGLDLRRSEVQAHWQAHFVEPLQELRRQLGARRVDVQVLSTDAPATRGWRHHRPRCRVSAALPLRDVQLPPAPSWWPPAPVT